MDMGKYRALFVNEATDQLSQMSTLAVDLEKEDVSETVQSLFRLSHSIKGMAASMDFGEVASLAHAIEDLFSRYDRDKMRPEPESVDLVLETIDQLRSMISARESDNPLPPADALVGRIRERAGSVRGGPLPVAHAASAGVVAAPEPRQAEGLSYRVRVRIDDKCQTLGVRGFLVCKKLQESGPVASLNHTMDEIRAGKFDNLIEAVLTVSDPEKLEKQLRAITDVVQVEVQALKPAEPAVNMVEARSVSHKRALGTTVRVKIETLDQLVNMVGEFILARARIEKATSHLDDPALRSAVDRLNALVRDLSDQVMRVRLMPLDSVADLFPRAVREAARKSGRDVDFEIAGRDLETDRAVLEAVVDPIIHILRNCVDHGIELPADRVKGGKPQRGHIRMLAYRDRDTAIIQISDDGKGIDEKRVIAKAVKAGQLAADRVPHLTRAEALMLICLPGVSTASTLTETSGRGVGMSAVKTAVEQIGGTLVIDSEQGRGTTFTLQLPRSIAITNVLLIQAAGRTFSIPVSRVHSTIVLEPREVFTNRGKQFCQFRDETIPLFSLENLLNLQTVVGLERASGIGRHAVIIQPEGRHSVAIAVDRFLGQQEVFVRPIGKPLERIPALAGVTILGDGRPVFVLDPARLVETTVRGAAA
ncbi:MAG: chemotaxis protein CheA [Deltaproteobacteria bacterium]|nr:chemotaxis protein CheA [Deltaproteobacteria bacterium]